VPAAAAQSGLRHSARVTAVHSRDRRRRCAG
jgi:hypothetical protein